MADAPNPYAVTTLETARIPDRRSDDDSLWRNRYYRILLGLIMAVIVLGTAAAIVDIETIMASGPALCSLGLVHFVVTRKRPRRRFRWIAWSCVGCPIVCFLIIFLLGLGPREAQVPIASLLVLYATGMCLALVQTARVERARPQRAAIAMDEESAEESAEEATEDV